MNAIIMEDLNLLCAKWKEMISSDDDENSGIIFFIQKTLRNPETFCGCQATANKARCLLQMNPNFGSTHLMIQF